MVSRLVARARRTSTSDVLPAIAFVLCAVPPATNWGPRPAGYVVTLVALAVATAWALNRGHGASALSRREGVAVLALGGWMLLCLIRSGPAWDTALTATALAVLALAAPWSLMRLPSDRPVTELVTMTLGAAIVGSAVAAWVLPVVLGHGIHWRPGLPIGGASNNAVGLTLALAGAVAGARTSPSHRWWWRALATVAGMLVVQSLSRAGWILVLLLLVVVLLTHPRVHVRWGLPVAGLVAALALGELVRRREPGLFIDQARWDNAATALEAWAGSAGSVLFGLGPMRLWPWLALERGRHGQELVAMQHQSPWGSVLYHAHSTYLELLVEYGLIGLVLLLVVLGLVVRRCVREIRARGDLALVAVALLLSLPAMLVELYLVRGFVTALLWWTAALAVGVSGGRDLEAPRDLEVRR